MSSQGRKGSSPCRPPFQRCHRLQARLEALNAGLLELSLLRERQERLVKEAMSSSLQKYEDAEDEVFEFEEDKLAGNSSEDGSLLLRLGGNTQNVALQNNHHQQIANNHSNDSGKLETKYQNETKDAKSETSSRKSSVFFDPTNTDGSMAPRKNSADGGPVMSAFGDSHKRSQVYSDMFGDTSERSTVTLGGVRESVMEQMAANNDSTKDGDPMKNSAARVTNLQETLSLKANLAHPQTHQFNRRPRFITRSLSLQEPITTPDRSTTELITKEEMLRRKRRSVHEIDFSLGEHPELASHSYMGSSRAFRYPSPLHAISLQSALCLPGPEYGSNEQISSIYKDQTLAPKSHNQRNKANSTLNAIAGTGNEDHTSSKLLGDFEAKILFTGREQESDRFESSYENRTTQTKGLDKKRQCNINEGKSTINMRNNLADLENSDKKVPKVKNTFCDTEKDEQFKPPGDRSSEINSNIGENLSVSASSNFTQENKWQIDSSGHYNDGVVRSKVPVVKSSWIRLESDRQSEETEGVHKDISESRVPRTGVKATYPRRKNACVDPSVKRVQYEL